MFARLKRTSLSFLAVLGTFVVYRLIAVPLIEPTREVKRVPPPLRGQIISSRQPQNHLGGYARFFPEGAWERDNPIVLESSTSKLLLKEYVTQPDGTLKLNPCTVIYLPEGEAETADSHRRVIILQAPEGAVLKFDEAVDLGRGKIGRLQGGMMSGPVVIQSGPTKLEGGDDFFALTRDVQLQDNLIFTSADVDFRFGPSQGHGREMRIELLPGPPGAGNHGVNFGGVQSFQLLHDVRMHLQPTSNGFLPGDQAAAGSRTVRLSAPAGTTTGDPANNPPVDIRCQGHFEFDLVQNVATFHDRVDVVRPHPSGTSDQINGELLSLYFAPRELPVAASGSAGSAAESTTPSGSAAAAANDKGASQSGRTAASGLPQLQPRRLVVRGNPVIVRAESISGEMRGDRLDYDILERHMLMESSAGNVQIESPQLSGQVLRIEAWSREAKAGDPASSTGRTPMRRDARASATDDRRQNAPRQHNEIFGRDLRIWSVSTPSGNDVERITVDGDVRFVQSPAQPDQRPLETKGDFLEVLRANAPDAEVSITGRPAEINAQGLTMVGQTVHLNRGENRLWIDGAGRMVAIGQAMQAAGSQNDQSTENGQSSSDRAGIFTPNRGTTTVDWQGGMVFDGRTVKFDREVVAQRTDGEVTQTVRAPQMDVTMHEQVDFNATGARQQRPQIEWLTCRGGVWLENREAQHGNLINLDRLQNLTLLTVNQFTGDLKGEATPEQPGRMLSWRLGGQSALAMGMGGPTAARPVSANPAEASRTQINFLDVQFQRGITGNILPAHQELTFHEQVRCVYGPVPGWEAQLDADNPAGLPPGSMLMTCNQLTASQAAARSEGRGFVELEALGSTRVEGQRPTGDSFSALAERLTYSQAKDMLVLVGDGRSDAQLFRQEQPGAPQTKTAAGSIYYWPTTRQVKIGDLRFVDSTQFSNQPPLRASKPTSMVPSTSARSPSAQPAATPPRR